MKKSKDSRLSIYALIEDTLGYELNYVICNGLYDEFFKNMLEASEKPHAAFKTRHLLMFDIWMTSSDGLETMSRKFGYSEATIKKNVDKLTTEFRHYISKLEVQKHSDHVLILKDGMLLERIQLEKPKKGNIRRKDYYHGY